MKSKESILTQFYLEHDLPRSDMDGGAYLKQIKKSSLNKVLLNYTRGNVALFDELRSEIFLILAGKDEKFIQLHYNNDSLLALSFSIAQNLLNNKWGKFRKTVVNPCLNKVNHVRIDEEGNENNLIEELADIPEIDIYTERFEAMTEKLKDVPFFNRVLLEDYFKLGKVKKVAEKNKFPVNYTSLAIQAGKLQLGELIEEHLRRKQETIFNN